MCNHKWKRSKGKFYCGICGEGRMLLTKKSGSKYKSNTVIGRKDRFLRRTYGITFDQMKQMYIAQNGCCAIHKGPFKSLTDIQVDHNHKNGQVRQLLCWKCNSAIGLLQDNAFIIQNAADYINKWNSYII
jgi:hypothetical protein